jgi:hypothetical protein
MKAKQPQGRGSKPPPAKRSSIQHFDTMAEVGTAITFAPTGEKLRIAKISAGKITFEKLP